MRFVYCVSARVREAQHDVARIASPVRHAQRDDDSAEIGDGCFDAPVVIEDEEIDGSPIRSVAERLLV